MPETETHGGRDKSGRAKGVDPERQVWKEGTFIQRLRPREQSTGAPERVKVRPLRHFFLLLSKRGPYNLCSVRLNFLYQFILPSNQSR